MKPRPKNKLARARLELVKAYILDYWRTFSTSPSRREIADRFQTSTSVVETWIVKLEKSGWMVQRRAGLTRQIVPAKVREMLKSIPTI